MALLDFEERLSESPLVERVWRNHSERSGAFTSIALSHYQMCVWTYQGKTTMTLRGPETKATPAFVPADADFLGVIFKFGVFLPDLPAHALVDSDLHLPDASDTSFWMHGTSWQYPTYHNVDTFIDRLGCEGLILQEPVVDAVVRGHLNPQSLRTVQRRFLQATGLTQGLARQIERARRATILLREGASILDTVYQAGYADQPHMTRSLKLLIGKTPAQLASKDSPDPLSFLFKTTSPLLEDNRYVRSSAEGAGARRWERNRSAASL